jgi:hypothetical protein
MTARWVAGSVRARAMPSRRLGRLGARALVDSASLPEAVASLARSPYGRFVRDGDSLAAAQRGVADTLLWNVRVLAGWVPPPGVRMLRLLAGWFELANIDELVRAHLDPGAPLEPPFRLGTLATAWPRLAAAGSLSELRAALGASPWGDPGADTAYGISRTLRLAWADRVAGAVEPARAWAAGAAALLLAADIGRPPPQGIDVHRLVGTDAAGAASIADVAAALAPDAAWVLRGVRGPTDLWRAEVAWWARVRADAARLVAAPGFGPDAAAGAVALLAVDAWLVRAALEAVALTGAGAATVGEVFDALA